MKFEATTPEVPQAGGDGVALAGAVVAELPPAGWERLAQLFLTVKRRQMERMDLEALHVSFPREVMEGNGSMVGYVEMFPWSDPFAFTRADTRWMADDRYCVQPGCECTQTALGFYRMTAPAMPPGRPAECDVFLRYDYVRGNTEVVETRPDGPAADKLMQALRTAYSDLERTFQERHRQMLPLERRITGRAGAGTSPVSAGRRQPSGPCAGPLRHPAARAAA